MRTNCKCIQLSPKHSEQIQIFISHVLYIIRFSNFWSNYSVRTGTFNYMHDKGRTVVYRWKRQLSASVGENSAHFQKYFLDKSTNVTGLLDAFTVCVQTKVDHLFSEISQCIWTRHDITYMYLATFNSALVREFSSNVDIILIRTFQNHLSRNFQTSYVRTLYDECVNVRYVMDRLVSISMQDV